MLWSCFPPADQFSVDGESAGLLQPFHSQKSYITDAYASQLRTQGIELGTVGYLNILSGQFSGLSRAVLLISLGFDQENLVVWARETSSRVSPKSTAFPRETIPSNIDDLLAVYPRTFGTRTDVRLWKLSPLERTDSQSAFASAHPTSRPNCAHSWHTMGLWERSRLTSRST